LNFKFHFRDAKDIPVISTGHCIPHLAHGGYAMVMLGAGGEVSGHRCLGLNNLLQCCSTPGLAQLHKKLLTRWINTSAVPAKLYTAMAT